MKFLIFMLASMAIGSFLNGCAANPIDEDRQVLIGYSDGASYALSIALSNPHIVSAALCWAAGFVLVDQDFLKTRINKKPRIYLEYGTHDELFPFEQIAIPMRDNL